MTTQHCSGVAQAGRATLLLLVVRRMQSTPEVQLAPAQQIQPCLRALCIQTQQGTIGALHGLLHGVALQLHHASRVAAQAQGQVALIGYQQFCGHRWRRCAQVSGKIAETEVGFVTHRRYNRRAAGGDCTGQGFIVERPQVFQ
ncbi:hypothetical protein D3C73_777000 [compost metagenome]